MKFLNDLHEIRYKEMVAKSRMQEGDIERQSLFYILAGTDDLYSKSKYLYDFEDNRIITDSKVDLSSGSAKLVYLAFNLYNNYQDDRNLTVMDILSALDQDGEILALNAIMLRLNMKIAIAK